MHRRKYGCLVSILGFGLFVVAPIAIGAEFFASGEHDQSAPGGRPAVSVRAEQSDASEAGAPYADRFFREAN